VSIPSSVVTCPICTELYDEEERLPKTLACTHTFCQTCLCSLKEHCSVKAGASTRTKSVVSVVGCPLCKQQTVVKASGDRWFAAVPTNSTVMSIVEASSQAPQAQHNTFESAAAWNAMRAEVAASTAAAVAATDSLLRVKAEVKAQLRDIGRLQLQQDELQAQREERHAEEKVKEEALRRESQERIEALRRLVDSTEQESSSSTHGCKDDREATTKKRKRGGK